jgi:predicted nucleic acid-binding protein
LKYEIGNSLKSAVIQKRISFEKARDIFKIFGEMSIEYRDIDKKEVLNLSVKNNLSFYDASYLHLAKKNNAKLLTLDKRLMMLQ